MAPPSARARRAWLTALAITVSLLLVAPVVVLAHATIATSDPADGSTVATSPATITATFAEAFDTSQSSMQLLGPDGATLATNGSSAAATAETMSISGFGALPAGRYSVRWTTITPDDHGIERGTFSFSVASRAVTAAPAAGTGAASGGSGDVAIALVALAALVIAGLAWFLRRSR